MTPIAGAFAINRIALEASDTATEKGFWEGKDPDERFPECVALTHSELSEALEAHREGDYGDPHLFTDDTVGVELADAVIRIFDLAKKLDEKHGTNFGEDMCAKMEKNKGREYKHGKRY